VTAPTTPLAAQLDSSTVLPVPASCTTLEYCILQARLGNTPTFARLSFAANAHEPSNRHSCPCMFPRASRGLQASCPRFEQSLDLCKGTLCRNRLFLPFYWAGHGVSIPDPMRFHSRPDVHTGCSQYSLYLCTASLRRPEADSPCFEAVMELHDQLGLSDAMPTWFLRQCIVRS
jgi:hypothetical protein